MCIRRPVADKESFICHQPPYRVPIRHLCMPLEIQTFKPLDKQYANYTLISSNLMYPHNGKVMTKPKTLPIKLLDINEFLSSKGTHRAIMACKAGKVTPSNMP